MAAVQLSQESEDSAKNLKEGYKAEGFNLSKAATVETAILKAIEDLTLNTKFNTTIEFTTEEGTIKASNYRDLRIKLLKTN